MQGDELKQDYFGQMEHEEYYGVVNHGWGYEL
jgi:hypothetical protein